MFIGLSSSTCYPGTAIPEQAFAVFQMMFAAITPLLVTGAFAERLVWKPFIFFVVAWEVSDQAGAARRHEHVLSLNVSMP